MGSLEVDARVGTELAGYRIERVLGRGGMSVVYLAEDLRLHRKVALKLITPELAQDERFRERFLRESRLAASLDHSNIVPIYEAGETDGLLYIAMRYVEGTDLKRLGLQEGRLEPGRALDIVGQVAAALDVAHEHGLVHRDVKPANILIAVEGGREHCYLADFGLTKQAPANAGYTEPAQQPGAPALSTLAGGLTQAGQFVGTPDYMAPEQIEGRSVDGRADLYSLGCVLYECLVGEPPFRNDRLMGLFWAHVHEPPPSASERCPDLPTRLDAILAKALAKAPADRYQSSSDLVDAARRELAPRPDLSLRARAWQRLPLLLALTGAIILAATLAAFLLARDGPQPVPAIQVDSIMRIDPATNKPATTIPVGGDPSGVAVTKDGVWVISSDQRTLSRIDPNTNAVLRSVTLNRPTAVSVGEGAVWVASFIAGTVTKIDARTGALGGTISLGSNVGAAALAVGGGAVWVANAAVVGDDYSVIRVEPTTGRVVATILLPIRPTGISVGAGAVWVASGGLRRSLVRIDPARNEIVQTIELRFPPGAIAAGEGAVWITSRGENTVLRLDPATNQVSKTIEVGRNPTSISVGAGSVWVANSLDRTLSRIDAETGEVVATVEVRGRPDDVSAGVSGIWLTVQAQ